MLKMLAEAGWTHKISLTAIGASVTNYVADSALWFDSNILKLSAAATFLLTVTMTVDFICGLIRKNSAGKREAIIQELTIEKMRRELSDDDN